ncbi:MAG: TorF family putative porin [Opitutae bacterium]
MKKTALILAALVAGASLSAQTPAAPAPAAPAYTITTDFTYTTKYVFRGVLLAKSAAQPTLKLAAGDFYASIWGSMPLSHGYELEFDYTAGYGFKLADGWNVDTGLTVYTYPGLSSGDKATYEGFVGVNGTVGVLSSGTYAYYDFTLKAFTMQEALGYSITIDPKTSVNITATLGYVSPDAGSSYTYYGLGVTVPYKITEAATFTAGVQYASHNISGLDDNHFWGTVGLTYVF